MGDASNATPSTPEATAGVAQSRDQPGEPAATPAPPERRSRAGGYKISRAIARHERVQPHQRQQGDPVYRPLRVFALDPGVSKLDGAMALVNVPYEPLDPGPRGRLLHVVGEKDDPVCDLDDPKVLLTQGFAPARSDRRFQNQMVYAICSSVYAAFKAALGRDPAWGFERGGRVDGVPGGALIIRPRASDERNAHYDKVSGELNFGYFTADVTANGFMKGETVYTCLMHDVVAHEMTHALLDGMRTNFTIPTHIDAIAFHEAFADLVAVFQHFSYREVVLSALKKSSGAVDAKLLTELARPLAKGSEAQSTALRRACDTCSGDGRQQYDPALEIHELGSILVNAVFEAFETVYQRKVERYVRLARHGADLPSLGQLPADLQVILAEEASQLASQFLSICIRSIDYCPPVDVDFGEFLRAMITADRELVPDDPWGYREALIHAFRERGILPLGVEALDEAALVWDGPEDPALQPIKGLSFSELRFRGDPGRPAGREELERQASALGGVIANEAYARAFRLESPKAGVVSKPIVESIRTARRVGPDGQVLFDIIAEISQCRVIARDNNRSLPFYGGCTIILGPEGEIRYIIRKSVRTSKSVEERVASRCAFLESERAKRYWDFADEVPKPRQTFCMDWMEPLRAERAKAP